MRLMRAEATGSAMREGAADEAALPAGPQIEGRDQDLQKGLGEGTNEPMPGESAPICAGCRPECTHKSARERATEEFHFRRSVPANSIPAVNEQAFVMANPRCFPSLHRGRRRIFIEDEPECVQKKTAIPAPQIPLQRSHGCSPRGSRRTGTATAP